MTIYASKKWTVCDSLTTNLVLYFGEKRYVFEVVVVAVFLVRVLTAIAQCCSV